VKVAASVRKEMKSGSEQRGSELPHGCMLPGDAGEGGWLRRDGAVSGFQSRMVSSPPKRPGRQ
jgi:hypothetical protein